MRQDWYHSIPKSDCQNTDHRPDTEPPSDRKPSDEEKNYIEEQGRQPNRDSPSVFREERGEEPPRDIIDNRADTRQSSSYKSVREEYPVDHQRHRSDADDDNQIFKNGPHSRRTRRVMWIYQLTVTHLAIRV